jgi:hypothetical protein
LPHLRRCTRSGERLEIDGFAPNAQRMHGSIARRRRCAISPPAGHLAHADRVLTPSARSMQQHVDMPFPLDVRFRDMVPSTALEQFIRRWAVKLERTYERIDWGEVVIERPHQHQHQGQGIRVRLTLGIPGPDVVVSHEQPLDGAHEDAYVAVRDAFRAARRQLADRAPRVHDDREHLQS